MSEQTPPAEPSIDEQLLELRAEGWSFARIAKELDLRSAADAQHRFVTALATSPSGVRNRIRKCELARLGELAERIRCRPAYDEAVRAQLLDTVADLADVVRRSYP